MKLAIFASGFGSNFEHILNCTKNGALNNSEIVFFHSDKPASRSAQIAAENGIPSYLSAKGEDRTALEKKLSVLMIGHEVELVVLAGYMRIVGPALLENWAGKIINLHPSLLPAYKGKDAIRRAVEAGEDKIGVTVHYVDDGVDTGPVILQRELAGDWKNRPLAEIEERIHALERELMLEVLRGFETSATRERKIEYA